VADHLISIAVVFKLSFTAGYLPALLNQQRDLMDSDLATGVASLVFFAGLRGHRRPSLPTRPSLHRSLAGFCRTTARPPSCQWVRAHWIGLIVIWIGFIEFKIQTWVKLQARPTIGSPTWPIRLGLSQSSSPSPSPVQYKPAQSRSNIDLPESVYV